MRLASTFRRPRAPTVPTAALVALTTAALLPPDAAAQVVITQRPTDPFIAFEGEGNAQITNPTATTGTISFATMADAAASGGNVLYAVSNGFSPAAQLAAGDPNAATATYRLLFSQAGTYTLYYRWKANAAVTVGGSEANSIWIPVSFNAPPSFRSATNTFTATGTPPDTDFIATKEDGSADPTLTPQPDFTVTAANVGIPLSFTIQTRESDISLDRFIFSTQPIDVTGGSTVAFDAIPNSPVVGVPEPGSAGLVLLAGVAGFAARRRAGRGAPTAA
jgi:hypothetical protein